jgi:hypothetical protein
MLIARFNSHGSYSPQCAVKMYTGATVDELNSHCAFRCNESQAMIISEVQDDVYVITHPQPMMLIQFGKRHRTSSRVLLGNQAPCRFIFLPNSIKRRRSDPHKVSLWRKYITSHRPNARLTSHLVESEIVTSETPPSRHTSNI